MPYDKVVDSAKLDLAMKATADGIRETTNYEGEIPWDSDNGFYYPIIGLVSNAVNNARSEGYADGYSSGNDEGYNRGYSQGYDEGVPVGKQAEYEAFWNGAVPDYEWSSGTYRFAGSCWNDETFKPPRKIILNKNCNACFYACHATDITPYIGFKDVDSFSQAFSYSKIKKVSHIYVNVSKTVSLSSSFANSEVEWVEGLTVGENTKFSSTFNSASKLTHIIFYGTIGQNGLNLQWSPLDKESLISIVNALSTTTSGLSVTFSKSAVNKAFETSDGANDGSTSTEWLTLIGTRSNWTISLA